ncbi:MAG: YraN family protein [Propionibacteriaceae bacterium]|jgi:putative endonuclease|nr:YraN family protein [Propionibacteriaceae bacterium]
MNRTLGAWGEQLAAEYLVRLGWVIVARNWRCDAGELDIVALEPAAGTLPRVVAVEVKTKAGERYGPPLEAITHTKLRRLRALATRWAQEHPDVGLGVRLDAIGVVKLRGRSPQLLHIRGAS